MKRLLLPIMVLLSNQAFSQQTIAEPLGTVSGTTTISAHEAANGFDNDNLTYSGTGDLRTTIPSPSGGANVFLTNTSAPRTFIVGNLNSNASVTSIDINFEIFKSIAAPNSDFIVDYTVDGTTFLDPQTLTISTGATWTTQSVSFASPLPGIKAIRFRNSAVNSQYRLDNIEIIGNGAGAALPVKLSTFNLSSDGKDCSINWATNSEINNDYFNVEHSIDGKNFEVIGTVKGKGNSTQKQNYNYIHVQAPKGINYYKLTQVDFDGKVETFNVKSIKIGANFSLRAYPTESSDMIYIENPNNATIGIYDVTGKLQMAIQNENKIDISNLTNGIYFVKSEKEVIKFRKI